MHIILYPQQDATIWEKYPTLNGGFDTSLELTKERITTIANTSSLVHLYDNYNSRILVYFDLSPIIQKQISGIIPVTSSRNFELTLYNNKVEYLPANYTIDIVPLSLSGSIGVPPSTWQPGVGLFSNFPTSSNGVTWKTKGLPSLGTNDNWWTGSFTGNTTGSWTTVPGGSTWITSEIVTQSFNYATGHLKCNVNSIVEQWISSSYQNQGFLIKRSVADEFSSESLGTINFYSRDTNTIYSPTLRVSWDDSVYVTGSIPLYSLSVNKTADHCHVWIKNQREEYSLNSIVKFQLGIRDKFPLRTFTTSSYYDQSFRLPDTTEYAIYDSYNGQAIIPFGSASKVSHTPDLGNFFTVDMSNLQENCYYDIYVKVEWDPQYHVRMAGPYRFKVTNP